MSLASDLKDRLGNNEERTITYKDRLPLDIEQSFWLPSFKPTNCENSLYDNPTGRIFRNHFRAIRREQRNPVRDDRSETNYENICDWKS